MGSQNGADVPDNPGQLPLAQTVEVTVAEAVAAGVFGRRSYEAVRKVLPRSRR